MLLASEGSPTSADFTAFESASNAQLVNPFTGAFSYTIPLLTVPGPEGSSYPLALSYHSGLSPEEEASWVGYGWSLSSGAIQRNKRGYPDDVRGEGVTYYNRMPANQTLSVGREIGMELFSFDTDNIFEAASTLSISNQATLRYNNYQGWGYVFGIGLSAGGLLQLQQTTNNGETSFSGSINPAAILSWTQASNSEKIKEFYNKSLGNSLSVLAQKYNPGSYSFYSNALKQYPVANLPQTAFKGSFKASVEFNPTVVPAGPQAGANLAYSYQKNRGENQLDAYGYLYSQEATEADLMDYTTEREMPWSKNDHFMGIPNSGADFFSVSGEGLNGGFRLFSKRVGHFYPNAVENQIIELNALKEVEVMFGQNIGIQTSREYNLPSNGSTYGRPENDGNLDDYTFSSNGDEAYYFKFQDDPAAHQNFGTDHQAQKASFNAVNSTKGKKEYEPVFPSSISTEVQNGLDTEADRIARSSYIGYNTNARMMEVSTTGAWVHAYNKDERTRKWVNRSGGQLADGSGEIALTNQQGNLYVYGLPVYARNEKQIQYSLDDLMARGNEQTVYMGGTFSDSAPKRKLGQAMEAPYASSYLLTQITTPQYRDLSGNGPTDDDLGGYVRFAYTRAYGADNKSATNANFYKWRAPYLGLSYERNEASDVEDDMGTYLSGEKEVYYVDSIETKTHIAVFSTSDRQDGLEALANDVEAAKTSVLSSTSGLGKLQKLDKIELFAKDEGGHAGEKLKTVHFEYDYSLMEGQPNSSAPGTQGKLTLVKVWEESFDHVSAKISPFLFSYNYPIASDYASEIQARYPQLVNYGSHLLPEHQNPDYDAANVDRWGRYRMHGQTLKNRIFPWVSQHNDAVFDPAAWHLKSVQTPMGGKMVVHYEQADYQYVQDQRATAMISLQAQDSPFEEYIHLDVEASLGLSPGDPNYSSELQQLKALIENEVLANKKRVYFKFLYNLIGGTANLSNCSSDWVDGYVRIKEVGIDTDGLYLHLANAAEFGPYTTCVDWVTAEKGGLINTNGTCDIVDEQDLTDSNGDPSGSKIGEALATFINFIGVHSFPATDVCFDIDHQNSFFRLPLHRPKLGGGVRVKRLLMYDEGLENGDANLYGDEYSYTSTDEYGRTISSGVATNEPIVGREENPLVKLLPREKQGNWERFVAGEDKKEMEGPLGESFLPGASIGYSKVTVSNIHSGKTSPGFRVNEYYTAKDFPYEVKSTPITHKFDDFQLSLGVHNKYVDSHWLSQGYVMHFNNMHGQSRQSSTYAGTVADPESHTLTAFDQYHYYAPGEAVPVLMQDGEVTERVMGKETEVVCESRSYTNEVSVVTLEVDPSVSLFVPPWFNLTLFPGYTAHREKLVSHVINKVNRHTAFVRSKTSLRDGVYTVTEYDRFDELTGQPTLEHYRGQFSTNSAANNDAQYHNYNYTASHQHPALGLQSDNQNLFFSDPTLIIQRDGDSLAFFNPDGSPICEITTIFCPGDLVRLYSGANHENFYHLGETRGNKMALYPSHILGAPSTATVSNVDFIEVVQSGCQNQLNASVGYVTTYGKEIERTVEYANDPLRETLAATINNTPIVSDSQVVQLLPQFNVLGIYDGTWPDGTCKETPLEQKIPKGDWRYAIFAYGFDPHDPHRARLCISEHEDGPSTVNDVCHCAEDFFIPPVPAPDGSYGEFRVENNQLFFYTHDNPCVGQKISCLSGCPSYDRTLIANVVDAQATCLEDDWPYHASNFGIDPLLNAYERGALGQWRTAKSLVYRTPVSGITAQDSTVTNYSSGYYDQFVEYDWQFPTANDTSTWINPSTITHYSPHGAPMEVLDALHVPSAQLYGYAQKLPIIESANTSSEHILFESFERSYNVSGSFFFENGLADPSGDTALATNFVHSGHQSYYLGHHPSAGSEDVLPLKSMDTTGVSAQGLQLRFWARQEIGAFPFYYAPMDEVFEVRLTDGFNSNTHPTTVVAQAGDWWLMECTLNNFSGLGSNVTPVIAMKFPYMMTFSNTFWMDDVRLQPMAAQSSCQVYDPLTLQPMAVFDANHFARFIQYDGSGKAIREVQETERGRKTVSEAKYHVQRIAR